MGVNPNLFVSTVDSQTHGLKIGGYIGAMGVDLWDRPKWLKELQEHDVFVMTPAILLRLLTHAYISMKQVRTSPTISPLSSLTLLLPDIIINCRRSSSCQG